MKQKTPKSRHVPAAVLITCLLCLCQTSLRAQSATGWTGASDGLWNNGANWTNGIPNTNNPVGGAARILNFGSLGNARPNSTNNMTGANGVSTHRIFFNSGATNYTLYLFPGTNGTSLNDFSSQVPKIQNDSTNLQTMDMSFRMSGAGIATVANRAAEINPINGDLVFTTNSVVTIVTNTELRFYTTPGFSVTFYGPITNTVATNTCALMTSSSGGAGATVNFFNTHGFTNTFINNGTVRLGTNNVTSAPFTLGDTNLNNAASALQMDNGLGNNSALVVRAGSTNSRTIGNTSFGAGDATFSGTISLGTNLTTLAKTAGTLKFTGNVDFQNPAGTGPRILTVSGAGDTVFSGNFTNATTGVSVLTKTNAGTLSLLGGNAVRVLYNLGGGTISIANAGAIGVPTGVNYPDKINFTDNATLQTTNNFTLGRQAGGADNAGFRVVVGKTATFDVLAGSTLTIDGAIIDIPGTGAGKLSKISAGTLTLTASNTYSGNTTINNGTLALIGAGSIGNSANISIGSGATFDVSGEASTFTLGASQTLSNNASATGTLNGSLNAGSGTVSVSYTSGTPALNETNGTLTLTAGTVFKINNTGAALTAGSYKIISVATAGNAGSVAGTLPPVAVTGGGTVGGTTNYLKLVSGELYLVVNHPPVANGNSYSRNGLNTWRIAVTNLLANASDLDGDTLTLDSVGVSTNGVTLVVGGGYVQYANTNLVNDEFTYTVTDVIGGTNSAVIALTVGSSSGVGGQVNNFLFNGGTASMSFAGIPGYLYHVQVSTNLTDWNTVWTTNAPSGGVFQFDDSAAPQPDAYYRLMWNGN